MTAALPEPTPEPAPQATPVFAVPAGKAFAGSGIALFIAGVFLFSAMDALAKDLLAQSPALQVVWLRYVIQALVITAILAPRLSQRSPHAMPLRTAHPWGHFIRAVFQVGATGFFFASLTHIGLAEATALADTNPVLITLGAALFLGERLTRARILAVVISMIGALIILRPGFGVFTPAALLPIGCAICFAGNALMTRLLGQNEPAWTSLFYAAWFGTAMLTLSLPFVWQPLPMDDLWRYILLGLIGTASQAAVIMAFSRSEAGLLAPFGYLGIVFASVWSTLIYSAPPDAPTLIGALVIIGAGLYVWANDRARKTV
jgi:drug/metabolite transporter (DMT)-like permease